MLVLPLLLVITVLLVYPVASALLISFQDKVLGTPGVFIGLGNYQALFKDRVFWISLKNTLAYVAFTVPLSVAGGLALALLVEAGTSLRGLYRTLLFLPWVSHWESICCRY